MTAARMFVVAFIDPGAGGGTSFQGFPKSSPGTRTYHPRVDTLQEARIYNNEAAARRSAVGRGWHLQPVDVAIAALSSPAGEQRCG